MGLLQFAIYVLAGISILLAIGGLATNRYARPPGLLVASLIAIAFAGLAISLVHWWPLIPAFAASLWALRIIGRAPHSPRS